MSDFLGKIRFFDTTLRDGEQTPGVSLTPSNKLRIAQALDKLGVDAIEAGFPASSNGELTSVKLIAKEGLKADVYGLARGTIGDIDAVLRSEAKGVHLVIPTSDLHLKYKLKKSRDEVLRLTEDCTRYAKDHGLVVELSAEDATRSDFEFLKKAFLAGISVGADRICPCDTVGVLTPESTCQLFSDLKKAFVDFPISVHCHNDLGMAVANSITALQNGADQAHVTINGLGERAGNAALEEIATALKAIYKAEIQLKTGLFYSTSRLVSRLTGIPIPANKAVVGENAFTHESGMHTHGVLSHPLTYEPFSPKLVGSIRRIVTGKHAGSRGIKASLNEMGLNPTDEQVKEVFHRVKVLGDKGKRVTDADLQAIAETVLGLPSIRPIKLEELTVVTGDKVTPTASVRLNFNGKQITEASTGVGPVDAAMNAVRKAVSSLEPVHLEEYCVKTITGGTDAVTEVTVRLRKGERMVTATDVNEDIVMASVEAMLSGINVLMTNYNSAH